MVNQNSENLIQKRPGVVRISFSGIAFFILCAYMVLLSVGYIEWIPTNLVSLLLYGFVAVTALTIMVDGKLLLAGHTKWLAVVAAVFAISCLYAYNRTVAEEQTFEMVKLVLFSLMFVNVVNSQERQRWCMFFSAAAPIALFLYMMANGLLDTEERLGNELTGNANTFATLFMVGAICTVYFIFFAEKRPMRLLAIGAFVLQLYAIALAGSRKFFLVPIGVLAGVKLLSTDRKGRTHTVRNTLLIALLIWAVWWMLFNLDFLYDSIGYRMEGMIAAFTGEGEVDASAQERMDLIDRGLELWIQKPFFGWGIDNFKVVSGYYRYAHNNYVELLSGVGLVGFVTYYWFYGFVMAKLFAAKHMGAKRWFWLFSILGLLVFDYGAVSFDMYHIHIMLLLATISLMSAPTPSTQDGPLVAPEGGERE